MYINNERVYPIGSGAFSDAYRVYSSDTVYVITPLQGNTNDYTKEIYTQTPKNPHIPDFECISSAIDIPGHGISALYRTYYYEPIPMLSLAFKHARKLQKALLAIQPYAEEWDALDNSYRQGEILLDHLHENQDTYALPDTLITALTSIHTWATNYEYTCMFEFPIRNMKIHQGQLLLLDVVYFRY